MMHGTGVAVGREPFRERIRLEKRAIDFLRPGGQHAVQADGVGHGALPREPISRSDVLSSAPGGVPPSPPTPQLSGDSDPGLEPGSFFSSDSVELAAAG